MLQTHRSHERTSSTSFLQVSFPVWIPSANDQAAIWQRQQQWQREIWWFDIEDLAFVVWHRPLGVESWELSIGQIATRAKAQGISVRVRGTHLASLTLNSWKLWELRTPHLATLLRGFNAISHPSPPLSQLDSRAWLSRTATSLLTYTCSVGRIKIKS